MEKRTDLKEISVIANGSEKRAKPGQLLNDFLKELGFDPGLVVVERNLEALTPGERENIRLEEGDKLEIVRIVAGG